MTGNDNSITKLLATSKRIVSFMTGEITHICRDMKKRASGSEGEREAAEYMAGVLRNGCGCKDVRIETFRKHPSAFYGYFWFSMTFDVLCAILCFVSPWLSILSGTIVLLLFQFGLYKQIIDPLFKMRSCKAIYQSVRGVLT